MAVPRYPRELRIRVPQALPDALALAAEQHRTTPAEWVRQALLRSLAAKGVSLRDGAAAIRKPREAPGDLHRAWR
jgi:hypothetical protein